MLQSDIERVIHRKEVRVYSVEVDSVYSSGSCPTGTGCSGRTAVEVVVEGLIHPWVRALSHFTCVPSVGVSVGLP